MTDRQHVTLCGHPIATDSASLVLQHELEHRGVNPGEVLRAVKREHRADVET